jgi:hypothetical protein
VQLHSLEFVTSAVAFCHRTFVQFYFFFSSRSESISSPTDLSDPSFENLIAGIPRAGKRNNYFFSFKTFEAESQSKNSSFWQRKNLSTRVNFEMFAQQQMPSGNGLPV